MNTKENNTTLSVEEAATEYINIYIQLDKSAKQRMYYAFLNGAKTQKEQDKQIISELLESLEKAKPYIDGAYECAFPDEQENKWVSENAESAITKAKQYLNQ